jgi:hypothetical protein
MNEDNKDKKFVNRLDAVRAVAGIGYWVVRTLLLFRDHQ